MGLLVYEKLTKDRLILNKLKLRFMFTFDFTSEAICNNQPIAVGQLYRMYSSLYCNIRAKSCKLFVINYYCSYSLHATPTYRAHYRTSSCYHRSNGACGIAYHDNCKYSRVRHRSGAGGIARPRYKVTFAPDHPYRGSRMCNVN